MKRLLIAFAAAILILTGTSLPAQAGTWTSLDRHCRSGPSGKICVQIAKYTSGSRTTKHWRVQVYPAAGKWIQPLTYGQHGDNMGEVGLPVCAGGTCPRFTKTKIGKWRPMDMYIIDLQYKTPTGTYWVVAGRMTTKRSTCKTIIAGKVCLINVHKNHAGTHHTSSILQVFPKAGHTITPRGHYLYNSDLKLKAGKIYCTRTCKPQSSGWAGTLSTSGKMRQAKGTYMTKSGTASIVLREW